MSNSPISKVLSRPLKVGTYKKKLIRGIQYVNMLWGATSLHYNQGLSQDLESGCLKLAIVKYLGVQIFKGDHNIFRLQP